MGKLPTAAQPVWRRTPRNFRSGPLRIRAHSRSASREDFSSRSCKSNLPFRHSSPPDRAGREKEAGLGTASLSRRDTAARIKTPVASFIDQPEVIKKTFNGSPCPPVRDPEIISSLSQPRETSPGPRSSRLPNPHPDPADTDGNPRLLKIVGLKKSYHMTMIVPNN